MREVKDLVLGVVAGRKLNGPDVGINIIHIVVEFFGLGERTVPGKLDGFIKFILQLVIALSSSGVAMLFSRILSLTLSMGSLVALMFWISSLVLYVTPGSDIL